jgi:twitching motility protein PilT
MAQLDKLIDKLQPGQEIILEGGKAPVLKGGGNAGPMLSQQLSAGQIFGLVGEIAPALEVRDQVAQGRPVRFEYTFAAKLVTVAFSAENGQAAASLAYGARPADATPATAPPQANEPEINGLLRKMFALNASDLHLTSSHRPMVRVHGDMKEMGGEPVLDNEKLVGLLRTIMPPHNAAQFEELHDTDFAHEIQGLARFRVNVFMDRFGAGAVFRQIPMDIVTAEKLGLSKEILDLCYLSKGLVLVTGPTGSGKSTTLCALVDFINRNRKDHIITIEDPIEFVHKRKSCLINQREVHVHTKSFSQALRAALREDPDIVLVGEMRDLETISIAIETAETGHLVFGTLHTTTAASTVDRIIDQFPAERQSQIRTMLATSLKGVISQTLCKKIGGGRVAAMEVLFVNSAISNLIREGKIYQIPSIMQTGKKSGMTMLNDVLLKLVTDKQVEPEEAYIKAVDKPAFAAALKSKSIPLKLSGLEE